MRPSLRAFLPLAGLVVVLSAVAAAPRYGERTVEVAVETPGATGPSETLDEASGPAGGDAGGPGETTDRTGPGQAAGTGLECARGRNGGETDSGVSGDRIKLAATVVESGVGASFLGPVRTGMQAVLEEVNREGGICGRLLDMRLVDDGWDASRGAGFLRNFMASDVFALAVVPSSEGLRVVTESGDVRKAGIPVVGTDGMLISQYTDPWIWPVATSTISTMRIMAKNAYDRGARKFGIVYESTYHFGIEGAEAFNRSVKRLTGADVPGYSDPTRDPRCEQAFCGIVAGRSGYASEVQTFNRACGRNQCDFVALLLEPATAQAWIQSGGVLGAELNVGAGGPQPLFSDGFAVNCGRPCDGMWVWTGYNPPIFPYSDRPEVARFVRDVRALNSTADVNNSFLIGGYLGMQLLVEGLKQVGPDLTRDRLKTVLDQMDLDTGLSTPLSWRPDDRFANTSAQAFSIQFKQGFSGWRYEQTGFVPDPWPGGL